MKDLSCVPHIYHRAAWVDCYIPYRPWWSQTFRSKSDTYCAWRSDVIDQNDTKWPVAYTGAPNWFKGLTAACTAYDEKYPLPFPGFRPGQIWGVEYGDEFIVSDPLTKAVMRQAQPVRRLPHRTGLPHSPEDYARLPMSGPYFVFLFTDGPTVADATAFNALNVFLLVDPLCPAAAPWSGVIPADALAKVPR